MSLIKKAGQEYLIVTAKHHDGFSMLHTATTSYNVVDSTPFARDIIKELAEECKKQGIVFCPYYSIGDWAAADVMAPKFADSDQTRRADAAEHANQTAKEAQGDGFDQELPTDVSGPRSDGDANASGCVISDSQLVASSVIWRFHRPHSQASASRSQ